MYLSCSQGRPRVSALSLTARPEPRVTRCEHARHRRVIGEYRHRDAPRSGGSEPRRTVFPLAYASAEILVREPKHSMSSPLRRSSSMWTTQPHCVEVVCGARQGTSTYCSPTDLDTHPHRYVTFVVAPFPLFSFSLPVAGRTPFPLYHCTNPALLSPHRLGSRERVPPRLPWHAHIFQIHQSRRFCRFL
jgi:hypothetical protein